MTNALATTPLSALFNISRGNKFDLNKLETCNATDEGAVAFVNRSANRNGVAAHVRMLLDVEPYASGLISVALGGSALASFVQQELFYTGQNVDVLEPKEAMSLDEKLFYCVCIEMNRFRYSTFGREANRTLRDLQLPGRGSVPDWVDGVSKRAVTSLQARLGTLL